MFVFTQSVKKFLFTISNLSWACMPQIEGHLTFQNVYLLKATIHCGPSTVFKVRILYICVCILLSYRWSQKTADKIGQLHKSSQMQRAATLQCWQWILKYSLFLFLLSMCSSIDVAASLKCNACCVLHHTLFGHRKFSLRLYALSIQPLQSEFFRSVNKKYAEPSTVSPPPPTPCFSVVKHLSR